MKFKKMKAILTASALAATVFVSAGCGIINKSVEEEKLKEKLKEKYGEEFTVIKSYVSDPYWWDDAPGDLEAVCCPKDDPSLFFEVTFGLTGHGIYDDNYVQAVAARDAYNDLEEHLSQYYDDFFLDVHIYESLFEIEEIQKYPQLKNIPELTFEKYADAYGEEIKLSYYIVFNKEEINQDNFESVGETLTMYCEKFDNIQADFFCYSFDSETIEEFRKGEETDYSESNGPHYDSPRPEYLYCLEDNKFYLYRIHDDDGYTYFEADESPKTVNMKKYDLMKKLGEKYGEEFIVLESNYSTDDAQSTLEATCCPKDDEGMVFEATYSLADDAVLNDNYIQLVLEKKMTADLEQFLSDNCDNYFARAYVSKLSDYDANSANYAGFTSADDVTISSYEEMYGEKMEVTFYVVLDWARASRSHSYADEILGLYSKRFKDANISFHCFLQSIEMIEIARDISNDEDSTEYDVLNYMKRCGITDYHFKHEKDKGFYLFKAYEYRSGKEVIKDGSEFYESEE